LLLPLDFGCKGSENFGIKWKEKRYSCYFEFIIYHQVDAFLIENRKNKQVKKK